MDSATLSSFEKFKPLKTLYVGTVVDSDDPKTMGRVKIEIPGLTLGIDKKFLPWYLIMQPTGLGSSPYTQALFAVPQPNTRVVVMFPTEDLYAGLVIGSLINRPTFPSDSVNLASDYVHPQSSEHTDTKDWDSADGTTKDQKPFSPDFSEDYPGTWGWVDNSLNWFKVNMFKRTIEFVTNSFTKFKIYANGDTVMHISGNLKIIVEKDYYLEVRGSSDEVVYNSKNLHVLGNYKEMTEMMKTMEAKRGLSMQGQLITLN